MSLELLSFTLGITVNKLLLADEPLAEGSLDAVLWLAFYV